MYTLEITESAESDLDQITDYIGNVLANPSAALAVLDEIERVSETLEATPELFPLCSDPEIADEKPEYVKRFVREAKLASALAALAFFVIRKTMV